MANKQAVLDKIALNADQLSSALRICAIAGRGAIVLGSPGGGKTSVIRAMARTAGAEYIASPPLPTLDPTDLRGLPRVEVMAGVPRTLWSVPDFLPLHEPRGGVGVICYDDFTTAPPAVQAPFYQLWLEGELGGYKLPRGWVQFATGNYDTDRAGTHRSLTPMRSRWITLHLASDPETFLRGAMGGWMHDGVQALAQLPPKPEGAARPIRPEIGAFLRFKPDCLDAFNPDAFSYPCPRSWEIASDVLYATETAGVDAYVEHALLAGTVGVGTAAEVLGFLKHYRSLPDIDSILAKPLKALVPKEPAALYAVSAAVARRAEADTMEAVIAYLRRLPVEFQVFAVRDALRRHDQEGRQKLERTKAFVGWAIEHERVMIG